MTKIVSLKDGVRLLTAQEVADLPGTGWEGKTTSNAYKVSFWQAFEVSEILFEECKGIEGCLTQKIGEKFFVAPEGTALEFLEGYSS